ncbi:hypothetical protein BS47DRAFT_1391815 [Hydnum rufescens UP504]|uniref:Retrotransposon gag domain-containing protein n=1 Tax=Hydnum rufescens UP504 TaxID=1448309 RepID=A0A9P6DXW3_9AGAM|nr:hypothetical protein BS47DRAFT_1391815 [Hydnum rufescens UP504]
MNISGPTEPGNTSITSVTVCPAVPRRYPLLPNLLAPLSDEANSRKPNLEPPPQVTCRNNLSSDTTELTLVECVRTQPLGSVLVSSGLDQALRGFIVTKSSPLSHRVDTSRGVDTPPKKNYPDFSSGSIASSLTSTAWKPGHLTWQAASSLWPGKIETLLKESPFDLQTFLLTSRICYALMSTPSEGTQSLNNEACTNVEPVDQETLHRRTLLVSIADSIWREQGVNAAADVVAQIQSIDKNESVAYTTNSNAQGYVTRVLEDTPRTVSPLAAYSGHENELAWRNQEAITPGTLVSDEGTQLPWPRFETRHPCPSVDPLWQMAQTNHLSAPRAPRTESHDYRTETTLWPITLPPTGHMLSLHEGSDERRWNPQGGGPPDDEWVKPRRKRVTWRGAPDSGPLGPGPPGGGLMPVSITSPPEGPYNLNAYYELKFKLKFRPNDLPEYDGSDNSFVAWTEDLDRYAAGSQCMHEQLAFVATMRFTKHADVWWQSLPNMTKAQASQNWDSLKHIMQT